MKILRILTSSPDTDTPALTLHADSSLLLPGKPLFIPEEEAEWVAAPHLAIHLCRLGKNISERFAPRYRDRWSLALHITTADAPSAAPRLNTLRDLADSSIVLGEWVDSIPEKIEINGISFDPNAALALADPLISAISRRTTIKTGDILLIPIGTHLQLTPRIVSPGLLNVKVV